MPSLKAAPGHVVVKREEAPTQTKGGLDLPASSIEKVRVGVVIDHSPGHSQPGQRKEYQWEKDSRVVFGTYSGDDFKLGEETFTILHEEEIVAEIVEAK